MDALLIRIFMYLVIWPLTLQLRLRSVKVLRQVAAEPLRYAGPDSPSRRSMRIWPLQSGKLSLLLALTVSASMTCMSNGQAFGRDIFGTFSANEDRKQEVWSGPRSRTGRLLCEHVTPTPSGVYVASSMIFVSSTMPI